MALCLLDWNQKQESDDDTAEEPNLEEEQSSAPESVAGSEETHTIRKSHRVRKPVIRLTYDQPGNPSTEPVTIMHYGMVIQFYLNSPLENVK